MTNDAVKSAKMRGTFCQPFRLKDLKHEVFEDSSSALTLNRDEALEASSSMKHLKKDEALQASSHTSKDLKEDEALKASSSTLTVTLTLDLKMDGANKASSSKVQLPTVEKTDDEVEGLEGANGFVRV